MNDDVVRWLESAEGEEWSRGRHDPDFYHHALLEERSLHDMECGNYMKARWTRRFSSTPGKGVMCPLSMVWWSDTELEEYRPDLM